MRFPAFVILLLLTALLRPDFAVAASSYWQGAYAGHEPGDAQPNFLSYNNTSTFGVNGAGGGRNAGYNWQIERVIAGVEADFSGSSLGHNCPATTYGCEAYTNWVGTVRPRLGLAVGNYLPYVTGGLAYGNNSAQSQSYGSGIGSALSGGDAGWTAGGGVEYGIAALPVSLKAEYLHVSLDNSAGSLASTAASAVRQDIARLGLNYKFN